MRTTRRQLLIRLGIGTGALALLSACGPAATPAAPTTAPAAAPKPTTAPAAPAAAPTTAPAAAAKPTTAPAQQAPAQAAGAGKAFNGAWPFQMPPAGHFNQYVPTGILGGPITPGGSIYWDLHQSPLGIYLWADSKWQGILAEEWKLEGGNTFNVKLRSGIKWSDGTAFTSKDVATTFWVGRLENWTVWRYVDRIDTPSDTQVSFHMSRPSSVAERFIMRERMRGNVAQFGDFAKRVQDLVAAGKGADTDEWKKLRTEMNEFRPKEPLSVGPYKIDVSSMSPAQLTMVKNPGGFASDKVQFDRLVLYNGETPDVTPLVLAGDIDYATHGFPPATEKAFVDQGMRIIRAPLFTGPALLMHWEKAAAFQDTRLRRAIAHAVNREENARVALGDSAKAVTGMSGMSDLQVPQWMSPADQAKLNKYEFSLEKAASLMTEAGYAKGSDGVWAKGGQKLEFEMTFPAEFADWSASAQHLAESLTKFGIKIEPRGVNQAQHPIDVNEGRFQLAYRNWGTGNPHPQFSYIEDLRVRNTDQPLGGMKYPLKQETSAGAVDFDQLITQSGEGLEVEPQKAAISKMAVAFNELLPIIPLFERYGNNPVLEGKRVKGWLPAEDKIYKNPHSVDSFVILQILDGTLKPV
jgi:peptide/nickel transport system substrate-binding protein